VPGARRLLRMLTRCPSCRTVFRLHARDLRAARGRVRCGGCGARFDAIAELRDEDEQDLRPVLTEAVGANGGEPEPPVAGAPGRAMAQRADDPAGAAETMHAGAGQDAAPVETAAPAHGPARDAREPGADADPDAALRVLLDEPEPVQDPVRPALDPLDGLDVPAPRVPRVSRLMWALMAMLLLVAVALQGAWWFAQPLLQRYPQLQPWYAAACDRLGCAFAPPRDPDRLRILARDVREHPRYVDALLVNATLVNTAAFSQPFPVLELTLYDIGGDRLGRRRFAPAQYLDASIDRASGMKPGIPVHLVLEIDGLATRAVSFEFRFL